MLLQAKDSMGFDGGFEGFGDKVFGDDDKEA
jgi:hypothetical protein